MKLRKVSAVLMSMSMVGAMAVPTFADEAKTIEPCEITFWHAMNGKQEESLTALTDKFNEENEYGITVMQLQILCRICHRAITTG